MEYKLLVLPTCEENKELHLVTTIAEAIEEFKINRCVYVCVRGGGLKTGGSLQTPASD